MAQEVKPSDAERVVKGKRRITHKASRGPIKRMMNDIRLMLALIDDYLKGRYRKAPWWTVSAILVALLWVLNPMDLVPDGIPLLGLLDDAAVVSIVLAMTEQDLADYRDWKMSRGENRNSR